MQKISFTYLFFSLLLLSCTDNQNASEENETRTVSIRISLPNGFQTKTVDEDNPASEQVVNNISLFFTEPSSTTFTHSFVYSGYIPYADYQTITLPLEISDLVTKDIYVVANYDDQAALKGLTSTTGLQALFTPEVDKTNNLDPVKGFCMSGSLAGFDFTSGETAIVYLYRTCAKLHINLSFPFGEELSTNNSFLIQNAVKYTYVYKNATTVIPSSEYFNFASALPLTDNGSQVYTNTVYVYEATQSPILTVYAYMNGSTIAEEFTVTLPIPVRNYMYDLQVEILEDTNSVTRSILTPDNKIYTTQTSLVTYNEDNVVISHEVLR